MTENIHKQVQNRGQQIVADMKPVGSWLVCPVAVP